jgi:hypothetical protein
MVGLTTHRYASVNIRFIKQWIVHFQYFLDHLTSIVIKYFGLYNANDISSYNTGSSAHKFKIFGDKAKSIELGMERD